jgi:hypothetical protein
MRNFLIGALLVALVAAVGFYVYRQQNIVIQKPDIPAAR